MFSKDMTVGYLLDFYGELLSERARRITEQYYCEDLSLAEIAENEGISRQGVRHTVKRAEESLRYYEEKLGLAAHFADVKEKAEAIRTLAAALAASPDGEARNAAEKIGAAAESVISII